MLVLGIESSCDETAAAIVKDGRQILSSVIASQIDIHHRYGGVVPELASRMHALNIRPVVDEAVQQAGICLDDIEGVAATRGPGLIGALLVGFNFAKAFAWARKLPLAGVNHLEAHICSLQLLEHAPEFPFIALVVSGGHTNIYHVASENQFELMGQTRDDAAGEAFDKVAKMMNLGYPGGPVIENMARSTSGDTIRFPRPMLDKKNFDFSFSGIKSAVARHLAEHPPAGEKDKARIASAFQAAVIDVLSTKLIQAANARSCRRIGISGGVAANATFVSTLTRLAKEAGIKVFSPPPALCGDNAAMIAARGETMIQQNQLCQPEHDVFSRTRI